MKVAIFGGAGGIGSSVAFNVAMRCPEADIVLIDAVTGMTESHAMDLGDALALGVARRVSVGQPDDAVDAQVVVISAGIALRSATSPAHFLDENAQIVESIVGPLTEHGCTATFLLMTNPVDALVTWLCHNTGVDSRRIFGYTLNDSLRFRAGIGMASDVSASKVEAWVLGEHGGLQIPLFERIAISGRPIDLDNDQRSHVKDYVDNWYSRYKMLESGRSSTWSSGAGASQMVAALLGGGDTLSSGSCLLEGEYGITGISLGVPVTLSLNELNVLEWTLSNEESNMLHQASEKVGRMAAQIGSGSPIEGWR